jgi:hypothetical protein
MHEDTSRKNVKEVSLNWFCHVFRYEGNAHVLSCSSSVYLDNLKGTRVKPHDS